MTTQLPTEQSIVDAMVRLKVACSVPTIILHAATGKAEFTEQWLSPEAEHLYQSLGAMLDRVVAERTAHEPE